MQSSDLTWNQAAALREMLGYINFSEGSPNAHFQKRLSEFYHHASTGEPWHELSRALRDSLTELHGTSSAFQNIHQARAVIDLVFETLLPAYRTHHSDLLFHLDDAELFQPFLIARFFEAILTEGGPWNETDRILQGALRRLNDFVGYRPVAILERKRCEPYDHERVHPIPLFIRGAGVATGKYHDLMVRTLEILGQTDPDILHEAQFDLDHLSELALDPRAYDFGHPANQRPNYQFGEWDPHCIDNAGNYHRFILRQVTIDALLQRVWDAAPRVDTSFGPNFTETQGTESAAKAGTSQRWADAQRSPAHLGSNDLYFEASAVLAGTMLMASATSGSGPDAHDSSVTLALLVPKIARLRDRFYDQLIRKIDGSHGEKLLQEASRLHQPFGGARQYLNQFLARMRAAQLQSTHLARLYTKMGYADAGRAEAQRVRTASERITTELLCRIATTTVQLDQGNLQQAMSVAESIEDLLHRGIRCGALVDPWNILGFQGQFSIFPALENSVPDPRVEQLIELMERIFALYARLVSEASAAGDESIGTNLQQRFQTLASWWDQFATTEINGIPHVHGRKTLDAATHVAQALSAWRLAGEQAGNIKFWRQHSSGFDSSRAFAQVVDALLDKRDYVAAMALLMSWLSQAVEVPLHQEHHSFHDLAVRWLTGVLASRTMTHDAAWPLVMKFFDYMEANAEEYWLVPSFEFGKNLDELGSADGTDKVGQVGGDEAPSDVYSAAYDGVTYRDSAQDGHEGELVEGGPASAESEWDAAADRLEPRLQFLTTVATLFRIAADQSLEAHLDALGSSLGLSSTQSDAGLHPERIVTSQDRSAVLANWLHQLRQNQIALARLVQQIERGSVAQPLGSHDSLVEYDHNRSVREHLVYAVIVTQTESAAAIRRLLCALPANADDTPMDEWEGHAVALERALPRDDPATIRSLLPALLESLSKEPLLYRRLDRGGEARQIVAARRVQQTLRVMVESLPRAGLLRATYRVLQTARQMELDHSVSEGITEFDHLARTALRAIVESVVEASLDWTPYEQADTPLLECLEEITQPFMKIWLEHSQSVRLTALDRIGDDAEWQAVREFIEEYGRDLLTPPFLTLGNLRAILDRGAGYYLDYLIENPDPLHPIKLIEHLDRKITRVDALRFIDLIMQVFVENYEEYKDYNITTTQSDYGERFFILFEFLRVKAWYVRASWNLQPVGVVHEAMARSGKVDAARQWHEAVVEKTAAMAEDLLENAAALEKQYGVRLTTVKDLLAERFTRPLALDRVRLLIGPAMQAAQSNAGLKAHLASQNDLNSTESAPEAHSNAFDAFREAMSDFTDTTSGVGLDVPPWLRALEEEVNRLHDSKNMTIESFDSSRPLRRARFSRKHVDSELEAWDEP